MGGRTVRKIAFVRTRYLRPSETFIYEELKNIKAFEPIVYTRKKMNVDRFPFRKIKYLPRSANEIAKSFKKKKIKLIHARFGSTGVSLMNVKKRLGIPMLTSFHGFDLPSVKDNCSSYQKKLPMLFRVGDLFTVPSQHMKRKLIKWGCPPGKIRIMYSGIDLNRFTYIEREPKTENITILAVGRLHKKKGFRYLVKAFKKVVEQHPTSQLVIVGEGDERETLKKLISDLKLSRHVRLLGLIPHTEMSELLNQADIFCLPSITTNDGNQEGIPNAIKEAMATGLPIVSTFHGGIPELVTDKWEGLLVPEKNVGLLAIKIKYLIQNPSVRMEMGKRGREKVENSFDSSKQVRILEELYSQLIKER